MDPRCLYIRGWRIAARLNWTSRVLVAVSALYRVSLKDPPPCTAVAIVKCKPCQKKTV